MSMGGVEELTLDYDACPAKARARRWRRQFRSRLVSLGISVVVLVALYVWQHDRFNDNPALFIGVYAVVLLLGIAWVVGNYAAYRAARTAAASVEQGVALRINRAGIELGGRFAGWAGVSQLCIRKGRRPNGPELCLTPIGGESVSVPLDQLDVRPGTLDSTARAYSGGRWGVDLGALDA